jgi:hypothetical protein
MMRLTRAFLLLLFLLILPATASAQWYAAAYLGASHTQRADVSVDLPARGLDATFRDVEFTGESFESPQYYGYRVGRLFGGGRRIGVEFEFIHLKVFAVTGRGYVVDGTIPGEPAGRPLAAMDAIVQRYSMSHGLNYILINVVSRTPLVEDRVDLFLRGGAGPTLPHSESSVLGLEQYQYEYAGWGVHAAAGLEWRLRGPLGALLEYKFTFSKPEITLAEEGRGEMRAASHQVAFGLAFGGRR